MTIHIQDLKFQAILGILDFERINPQDIIINTTIEYHYEDDFINYAEVVELIKSDMTKHKFLLIEDALTHLFIELKKKFPKIDKIELKITKPSILPDVRVSVSDIYIFDS